MLKELCCTAMLLTAGANLYAQEPQSIEKSQTIVYINGAKYYVHNVRHGETLYSLAKTYGVAEQVIAAENPQLAQGLKADQSLKIPVVETGVVVQEQLSPKKLKKTFDQHTVQKGETLYGISRRYAISVETIMEDNPGLDPIHLKPGSVILIRKKAVGKTDEAENTAAWEQYKDRLNLVAEEGYMYHIVAPGETMYALSRRFGTTVENLERLNGISAQELRSGSMLKVPRRCKVRDRAGAGRAIRTARANGERYLDDGRTPGERGGFSGIEQRRAASCGAVAADDRWRQTESELSRFLPGISPGA